MPVPLPLGSGLLGHALLATTLPLFSCFLSLLRLQTPQLSLILAAVAGHRNEYHKSLNTIGPHRSVSPTEAHGDLSLHTLARRTQKRTHPPPPRVNVHTSPHTHAHRTLLNIHSGQHSTQRKPLPSDRCSALLEVEARDAEVGQRPEEDDEAHQDEHDPAAHLVAARARGQGRVSPSMSKAHAKRTGTVRSRVCATHTTAQQPLPYPCLVVPSCACMQMSWSPLNSRQLGGTKQRSRRLNALEGRGAIPCHTPSGPSSTAPLPRAPHMGRYTTTPPHL